MDGIKRLRTKGMLTYDGFTTVLLHLLESAWGPEWGTFTEADPQLSDGKDVSFPRIIYSVKEARPGIVGNGNTREIRPRVRQVEEVEVNGQNPKLMMIYGQRFDYVIEFTVWAENNRQLDIVTEQFKELMMTYGGFITKQGLTHLVFDKMEGSSETLKDKAVSRSLFYRVGFEHISLRPTDAIERIEDEVLGKLGE